MTQQLLTQKGWFPLFRNSLTVIKLQRNKNYMNYRYLPEVPRIFLFVSQFPNIVP